MPADPFGKDAVEAVAMALENELPQGMLGAPTWSQLSDYQKTIARGAARAALAAARPFVDRWYPIETAPMSPVLYRDACGDIGHCAPMFVDDQFVGWWDEQRDDEATPVWWRPPLPAPPAEETPTESKGGE